MNSVPQESKNNGCFGCLMTVLFFCMLGWIAIPSYQNMANKAKQTEAKQTLSAINKSQETYQRQKNTFSHNFDALNVGIKPQTTNYIYFISATKTAAFSYAISRNQKLKSYVGAVFLVPAKDQIKTVSILCQDKSKGTNRLQDPILQNGVPICGADNEAAR